jgi:hypothetical protein
MDGKGGRGHGKSERGHGEGGRGHGKGGVLRLYKGTPAMRRLHATLVGLANKKEHETRMMSELLMSAYSEATSPTRLVEMSDYAPFVVEHRKENTGAIASSL